MNDVTSGIGIGNLVSLEAKVLGIGCWA